MPVRLIDSLATTAPLADVFSDASVLQAMLDFEIALARAEATLKIIPASAAQAIASAATPDSFNSIALSAAALNSATLAIPFVKQLTECVGEKDSTAASYVHWGATSQDLCDTAFILLLKKAEAIFSHDLRRLESALARISEEHKDTVMLGRTLLQAATPITFGLKAAGWLGSISRSHQRLQQAFQQSLVLQFGGASGTLAALGDHGLAVAEKLAVDLQLALPDAPWHTHRDRLAELVFACGVLTGSLGKMAQDISLLMQNEVAEVAEPSAAGKGSSSTMPHKRNPVGCVLVLAASNRVPGLVANFLTGMVQEHERAAGNWQAEWATVSVIIQSTGLAIQSMADVAEGLTVDAAKMRANIEATQGRIFAERAMLLLSEKLGREKAHKLLEEATHKSAEQNRHLRDVLAEAEELKKPEVKDQLGATLANLEKPELYLGSAEQFRKRLLASVRQEKTSGNKAPSKE